MDLKLVHEDYKFYFNKKVVYNYLKLWYYKDTNTKERKKILHRLRRGENE